ncbi:R3H domain-containing protein 4-like [Dreissena polymorpha]|uniref:R3H-associated N-terminal domain-containing protein n=1 Tax=Dreissena polymorpha TaxID=45954 RepID=A0A9D3YF52_DREPO|nr:R3H domain-containing protein 4-like [Dreissena polymorpha]KAH3697966.1 hypothetical protein DPMN_085479 [Dreissena polymorpha]
MGVIRGKSDWLEYGLSDDMEHIIEPVSSSDNESLNDEPAHVPRRKAQTPKSRPPRRDGSIMEAINRRRIGQKQARRCGNLGELMALVESDGMEIDFNMFEPSMSVFAELFAEKEKMEAWNDFVNSTEEQQLAVLTSEPITECCHDNQASDLDSEGQESDDSWEHVQDKRATHPCFSAEECFQRIDKNIRTMLKRRHKPMGMLVSLEGEIVNFFKEWPQSVYVSKLASSYERMMLHALCQYLQLISKSFDSSGIRQTQVENPHSSFQPPPTLLTDYLDQHINSNPPLFPSSKPH